MLINVLLENNRKLLNHVSKNQLFNKDPTPVIWLLRDLNKSVCHLCITSFKNRLQGLQLLLQRLHIETEITIESVEKIGHDIFCPLFIFAEQIQIPVFFLNVLAMCCVFYYCSPSYSFKSLFRLTILISVFCDSSEDMLYCCLFVSFLLSLKYNIRIHTKV